MLLGIVLAIATAAPAEAEVVKCIDSSGGVHYVDSIEKVPPEYRSRVAAPTLGGSVAERGSGNGGGGGGSVESPECKRALLVQYQLQREAWRDTGMSSAWMITYCYVALRGGISQWRGL